MKKHLSLLSVLVLVVMAMGISTEAYAQTVKQTKTIQTVKNLKVKTSDSKNTGIVMAAEPAPMFRSGDEARIVLPALQERHNILKGESLAIYKQLAETDSEAEKTRLNSQLEEIKKESVLVEKKLIAAKEAAQREPIKVTSTRDSK